MRAHGLWMDWKLYELLRWPANQRLFTSMEFYWIGKFYFPKEIFRKRTGKEKFTKRAVTAYAFEALVLKRILIVRCESHTNEWFCYRSDSIAWVVTIPNKFGWIRSFSTYFYDSDTTSLSASKWKILPIRRRTRIQETEVTNKML